MGPLETWALWKCGLGDGRLSQSGVDLLELRMEPPLKHKAGQKGGTGDKNEGGAEDKNKGGTGDKNEGGTGYTKEGWLRSLLAKALSRAKYDEYMHHTSTQCRTKPPLPPLRRHHVLKECCLHS